MKSNLLSISLLCLHLLVVTYKLHAQENTNYIVKKVYPINLYKDSPKNVMDFEHITNCQNIIIFNKSPKKIDYIWDAYEVVACGVTGYLDRKIADISSKDLEIINKWKQEDRELRLFLAKTESVKLDSIQKKKEELERIRVVSIINYEDSTAREGLLNKIQLSKNIGLILYWNWNEDGESLVSQSFNFTIINKGKKTIKYIYFTVSLLNPVNDFIGEKSLRGIGPLKSEESAEYSFKNAYFSKVVKHVKIKSIKIEYMDGTSKFLPMSVVNKVTISNDEWKYLKNQ